jgi:predicted Rdx family selenoprotein
VCSVLFCSAVSWYNSLRYSILSLCYCILLCYCTVHCYLLFCALVVSSYLTVYTSIYRILTLPPIAVNKYLSNVTVNIKIWRRRRVTEYENGLCNHLVVPASYTYSQLARYTYNETLLRMAPRDNEARSSAFTCWFTTATSVSDRTDSWPLECRYSSFLLWLTFAKWKVFACWLLQELLARIHRQLTYVSMLVPVIAIL